MRLERLVPRTPLGDDLVNRRVRRNCADGHGQKDGGGATCDVSGNAHTYFSCIKKANWFPTATVAVGIAAAASALPVKMPQER